MLQRGFYVLIFLAFGTIHREFWYSYGTSIYSLLCSERLTKLNAKGAKWVSKIIKHLNSKSKSKVDKRTFKDKNKLSSIPIWCVFKVINKNTLMTFWIVCWIPSKFTNIKDTNTTSTLIGLLTLKTFKFANKFAIWN